MRFLRSVYLVAGFYSTIALGPAAAQQPPPSSAPAKPAEPPRSPASALPGAASSPSSNRGTSSAPAAPPPASVGAAPSPSSNAAAGNKPGPSAAVAASASGDVAGAPALQPGAGAAPSAAAGASASGDVAGAPALQPGAGAGAAPDAGQRDARSEGARLAKQRGVVVPPSHDAERPPTPAEPEGPSDTGFAARLSLGLGGALWISGGDTKLSRPFWLGLDLGYALTRNLTLFARGTSWFPYDNLANEFVGAGAAYRFVAERVYVAPALGASFLRQGAASDWSHYFQGLAFEADVGQYFPLPGSTSFSFGAHFQIGTPLFANKRDGFTSLQAGIFVGLGLH